MGTNSLNKKVNNMLQVLVICSVVLLLVVGWIFNIINIVHTEGLDNIGLLIAQIIGVFIAPLGAVLGWVI